MSKKTFSKMLSRFRKPPCNLSAWDYDISSENPLLNFKISDVRERRKYDIFNQRAAIDKIERARERLIDFDLVLAELGGHNSDPKLHKLSRIRKMESTKKQQPEQSLQMSLTSEGKKIIEDENTIHCIRKNRRVPTTSNIESKRILVELSKKVTTKTCKQLDLEPTHLTKENQGISRVQNNSGLRTCLKRTCQRTSTIDSTQTPKKTVFFGFKLVIPIEDKQTHQSISKNSSSIVSDESVYETSTKSTVSTETTENYDSGSMDSTGSTSNEYFIQKMIFASESSIESLHPSTCNKVVPLADKKPHLSENAISDSSSQVSGKWNKLFLIDSLEPLSKDMLLTETSEDYETNVESASSGEAIKSTKRRSPTEPSTESVYPASTEEFVASPDKETSLIEKIIASISEILTIETAESFEARLVEGVVSALIEEVIRCTTRRSTEKFLTGSVCETTSKEFMTIETTEDYDVRLIESMVSAFIEEIIRSTWRVSTVENSEDYEVRLIESVVSAIIQEIFRRTTRRSTREISETSNYEVRLVESVLSALIGEIVRSTVRRSTSESLRKSIRSALNKDIVPSSDKKTQLAENEGEAYYNDVIASTSVRSTEKILTESFCEATSKEVLTKETTENYETRLVEIILSALIEEINTLATKGSTPESNDEKSICPSLNQEILPSADEKAYLAENMGQDLNNKAIASTITNSSESVCEAHTKNCETQKTGSVSLASSEEEVKGGTTAQFLTKSFQPALNKSVVSVEQGQNKKTRTTTNLKRRPSKNSVSSAGKNKHLAKNTHSGNRASPTKGLSVKPSKETYFLYVSKDEVILRNAELTSNMRPVSEADKALVKRHMLANSSSKSVIVNPNTALLAAFRANKNPLNIIEPPKQDKNLKITKNKRATTKSQTLRKKASSVKNNKKKSKGSNLVTPTESADSFEEDIPSTSAAAAQKQIEERVFNTLNENVLESANEKIQVVTPRRSKIWTNVVRERCEDNQKYSSTNVKRVSWADGWLDDEQLTNELVHRQLQNVTFNWRGVTFSLIDAHDSFPE